MESTEGLIVLQNTIGLKDAEEEDQGPLLTSEERNTVGERIKVSIMKKLKYIRENKRKLAAAVMLWTAFLIATIAFSLLAPFFPQEVSVRCFTEQLCLTP